MVRHTVSPSTLGIDTSSNISSVLSGLTDLMHLFLNGTSITDIGVLSGLTSLEWLQLDNNSISDISPLGGLTQLVLLQLNDNSISDISGLSRLTHLRELQLNNNPDFSDIQPLLDNTVLGPGDDVYLMNTNVGCTDVAAVQAKGLTVESNCR